MDIYIDPELFKFHDKSNHQNRYITLQEIAFVACRITTSALNNGYCTHLVSYNTFLTKWKDDYKKFTDLSPTRHKLAQIIKILNKYNIIKQNKRGSNTPIYTIELNNPYHPDYKPAKTHNPEIQKNKARSQQTQSTHLNNTPEQLEMESDMLDKEFENILTNNEERS